MKRSSTSSGAAEAANDVTTSRAGLGAENRVRFYTALTVAILLLAGFGILVYLMNSSAATDSDLTWQRRVYLFGVVQAIVFTAVGWLFGREVNRQQVGAAQERAKESEDKADKAVEESTEAKAKVADLSARGAATKAAVLAHRATDAQGEEVPTKGLGANWDGSPRPLDQLAAFVTKLYPDY